MKEKFIGKVILTNNHYFIDIPFNVWEKWNITGQIPSKGVLCSNGIEEKFNRRLLPRGNGHYYLPSTKTTMNRLNNPIEVEVEIETLIDEDVIHFPGYEKGFYLGKELNTQIYNIDSYINDFYDMLFKRRSFHIFQERGILTLDELKDIEDYMKHITPLIEGIKTYFKIVPGEETTSRRKQEYCILLYSEKKEHYLENIGYMGEQLDLYLASKNIGSCWIGMANTKEKKYNDLHFVIMITIGKVKEELFRKNYMKSKRNDILKFWLTDNYKNIANIVRFAPSACNSQPWLIEEVDSDYYLFRVNNKNGLMPKSKVTFYNRIDIGIFILFLEIAFRKNNQKINFIMQKEEDIIPELVLKFNVFDLKKGINI